MNLPIRPPRTSGPGIVVFCTDVDSVAEIVLESNVAKDNNGVEASVQESVPESEVLNAIGANEVVSVAATVPESEVDPNTFLMLASVALTVEESDVVTVMI
jgi:hypothetical protein